MSRTLLYYHHAENGNFGDDLNPWLWSRLLGDLLDGEYRRGRSDTELATDDTLLVGIGTILDDLIPAHCRKIVMGSGKGYENEPIIDDRWQFLAVRGAHTAKSLGLSDVTLGDGAYLLTSVFMPTTRGNEVGFVPHHRSTKHTVWRDITKSAGVRYIDPCQSVEDVIRELLSCRLLITEAMHGAILADVFRIPWIPVKTYHQVLEFKWRDWTSSLGLKYEAVRIRGIRPDRANGPVSRWKVGRQKRNAIDTLRRLSSLPGCLTPEARITQSECRTARPSTTTWQRLGAISV